MATTDPKARLHGMGHILHGLHNSGLLIGSLADKGGGTSLWRRLRLRQNANNVTLHDCFIDVRLGAALTPKPNVIWQKCAAEGAIALAGGNYAYHAYPAVGECDLTLPPDGEARLCFSTGGLCTDISLHGNLMVHGGRLVPLPPLRDGVRLIRFQMDNDIANIFVDGNFCSSEAGQLVTQVLKNNAAMATLNDETGGVLRNSGLVVKPVGVARVKALRFSEYPSAK